MTAVHGAEPVLHAGTGLVNVTPMLGWLDTAVTQPSAVVNVTVAEVESPAVTEPEAGLTFCTAAIEGIASMTSTAITVTVTATSV